LKDAFDYEIYIETKLIKNPATSENKWAASDKIANEPDITPPANSAAMNKKQITETKKSFFIAYLPSSIFLRNFLSFSNAHKFGTYFSFSFSNNGFFKES
jgi:hypothetical protein